MNVMSCKQQDEPIQAFFCKALKKPLPYPQRQYALFAEELHSSIDRGNVLTLSL